MAIVHAITHPLIIIEEGLDILKLFATIHSLSFFLFIPQSDKRNQNHMNMKKNIMVNIGTYYTWARFLAGLILFVIYRGSPCDIGRDG